MTDIDTAAIRSQHEFRTSYGTEMDDVCQFCWPTNLDGEETRHDCEVIDYMDEIDDLRARLAEAEAERDQERTAHRAAELFAIRRAEAAEARLTALTGDLDSCYRQRNDLLDSITDLKARLAEVEALCDEVLNSFTEKGHPGRACLRTGWIYVETVERWRAAALGEGDRPAEPWPDEDAARFLEHERAQRVADPAPADHIAIFDGPPLTGPAQSTPGGDNADR